MSWDEKTKLKTSWGTFFVLYISLIVFTIIYEAGNTKTLIFYLTFIIFGTVLGWIVGTLASPYSSEKQEFSSLVKAVSAFVSGYALAKIDPLITEFLKKENLNNTEVSFRTLVFLCSFLLAMIFTFLSRKYFRITK